MALDTYKAVKMLTEVGFDEPQAEAVVTTVGNAFDDSVATKTDIAEVRAEVRAIRAEMRELEQRMTIKMGGFIAAAVGLITALNKLIG